MPGPTQPQRPEEGTPYAPLMHPTSPKASQSLDSTHTPVRGMVKGPINLNRHKLRAPTCLNAHTDVNAAQACLLLLLEAFQLRSIYNDETWQTHQQQRQHQQDSQAE